MTYDKWEPDRPSQEVLAIMQSATLPRSCLRLAGGLPGRAYTRLCTTTAIDIASAVPNLLQLGQGGAPALAVDMGQRGPMGTEV